ncbi:3D domain-containing protein [Paenibacillus sp. NPDC056579]|uniref:3D domain-containing protein n=1 Tax=unclassified Paenibacillus TaxID=185978 RepID=UPI001EF921C8|nr:3D domain-containing protein [Paenibacillus sp. H1-7]ULL13197.1 LysM peptidoglycan-binding domain-containing protein [Paenibacillus sp. H1-7]
MFRKRLNIVLLLPSILFASLMMTAGKAEAYHVMDDYADMSEYYSTTYYPEQEPVVPETVEAPQPIVYQVNSGDTLYKIARDFGISIAAIMAENGITEARYLSVGQQLTIPSSEAVIPLPDGQQKVVKQVLSSTLTAYTAGKESTGKTPSSPAYGITYSGSKAEEGRTIAVDPSVIPIGTTVFIDGIGIRTAEDTGSAVKGARIDVFMDDLKQAVNFGVKKNVKVYVLS